MHVCKSYKKENKKQIPSHVVWAKSYYEYVSLSLFYDFCCYVYTAGCQIYIPYIDCFTFHLTCILRNLYAGQEATVRMGYGTMDWFQIGIGGRQGCILSPCLFNFYAEYIIRNAGLVEAQAGVKIARRYINHLRYADDTTLIAESEEN